MHDFDPTTGAGPNPAAPRFWVLTDDHGDPRILLRTGPRGILGGDIDRWYGARRKWDAASGYLSSRLVGLGGDSEDADEVEPDEVPRLIAYLGRRSKGGRTDRRLPYDALPPVVDPDGERLDPATMSLLLREADMGVPASRSRAPDTAAVRAYRKKARAEVAAIRRRGGMLDMPVEPWD